MKFVTPLAILAVCAGSLPAEALETGNTHLTTIGSCSIPSFTKSLNYFTTITTYGSYIYITRSVPYSSCTLPNIGQSGGNQYCPNIVDGSYTEAWVLNTSNSTFGIQTPGTSTGGYPLTGSYTGSVSSNSYGGDNVDVTLGCGAVLIGATTFIGG